MFRAGDSNGTYLTGLLGGINELDQALVHGRVCKLVGGGGTVHPEDEDSLHFWNCIAC